MKEAWQHKKCAELLKTLFCHPSDLLLKEEYTKLCSWMGLKPLAWNAESIEQRFHEHLQKAEVSLMEHDFLHGSVSDQPSGGPWGQTHTYLDGLRSCHNVGSIIRTVEAFRLGPVHFSSDMMPSDHPQIQKTSMGARQWVEISQVSDPAVMPRPWIGIETVATALPWNDWIYPSVCTIIVGNEERGICQSTLQQCDGIVTIPMVGQKQSLNVANAFAIVASEIASQRAHRDNL